MSRDMREEWQEVDREKTHTERKEKRKKKLNKKRIRNRGMHQ